jgi:hypothetical protein
LRFEIPEHLTESVAISNSTRPPVAPFLSFSNDNVDSENMIVCLLVYERILLEKQAKVKLPWKSCENNINIFNFNRHHKHQKIRQKSFWTLKGETAHKSRVARFFI